MILQKIKTWMRVNKWQFIGRAAWIGLNFALGFWAAWQLTRLPGVILAPFWDFLIALIGGILPAMLWTLQSWAVIDQNENTARRLRNGILTVVVVPVICLLTVFILQQFRYGQFPPINRDHEAVFRRLWRAMDRAYPYFEEKGLDWGAVYETYLPEVQATASDEAFYEVIDRMLLELEDSHTGLLRPPVDIRCCFGLVDEIEGQAVVTQPGKIAQEAGIQPGSVILEVGGNAIEDALEGLPPRITQGSTVWLNRANAFNSLLSTNREQDHLEVQYQDLAGEEHRVDLFWPEESPTNNKNPILTSKRLPSGIGYIRIVVFGSSPEMDLVEAFDQALGELWETPGLIIDLRGNRGGNSALGDEIAGRFFEAPIVYGEEYFPARLAMRGFLQWGQHRVEPRGAYFEKPVILLIDHQTISSGEYFVAAMADTGRAQTVGRRTAGASGNPLTFKLGGEGLARYSTGDFKRLNGQSIEGYGIQPDTAVEWTVEDVIKGEDPDIRQAEAILLGRD